jgi:hypothetical protein
MCCTNEKVSSMPKVLPSGSTFDQRRAVMCNIMYYKNIFTLPLIFGILFTIFRNAMMRKVNEAFFYRELRLLKWSEVFFIEESL